jgi:hypothetical protein
MEFFDSALLSDSTSFETRMSDAVDRGKSQAGSGKRRGFSKGTPLRQAKMETDAK